MNLRRGSSARRLIIIAILLGIFAVRWMDRDENSPSQAESAGSSVLAGSNPISAAFEEQRSGVWLEGSGVIDRLLQDDLEGDRHQRFIVRVSRDRTVLISHNIDLAARVQVDRGDEIAFRGRYEWNDLGGVVHWTHHDPQAGHSDMARGGWLRANGKLVR